MKRRKLNDIPFGEYGDLKNSVIDYVGKFCVKHKGQKFATFAHIAKRFAIKLEDVEALVYDCELIWNCGIQIPGVGYSVDPVSEYTVEPTEEVWQSIGTHFMTISVSEDAIKWVVEKLGCSENEAHEKLEKLVQAECHDRMNWLTIILMEDNLCLIHKDESTVELYDSFDGSVVE